MEISTGQKQTAGGYADDALRVAAEKVAEQNFGDGSHLSEDDPAMEAILLAEEELLRKLATGRLPAFGWPGPGRQAYRQQHITMPRERIPPELCAGAVCFEPDGSLAPLVMPGEEVGTVVPLFAGIVMRAEDILAIWPAPPDKNAQTMPSDGSEAAPQPVTTTQATDEPKLAARNTGGKPSRHDWDAFWIEVAHWAAEYTLEPAKRPELQKHMVDWATARDPCSPMEPATIRRKLAALYAAGGASN
ncbi:hypothetical protein ACFQX4_11740 [Roseomonas sp. GCM10028921]